MVAKSKKPHIGYSVLLNGLQYAYYGTVATKERKDELVKKFESQGNWTHVHEVNEGFSIFYRDGTYEHPKLPFGKTRPKVKISFEAATREREQKLNPVKKSAQKEPGERNEVRSSAPRGTLSEQEKRDKKKARRAARRARLKAAKETQG